MRHAPALCSWHRDQSAPSSQTAPGDRRRPAQTLTEDFDLTLQIIARGRRVAYEPRAIAYTEAPRTDAELRRQRIRWGRGGLQVFAKHRRMLGSPGLGLFGMFWLPYSLLSWYAPVPFAILGLALLPLMAWGSHSPDPIS